MRIDYNVTGNDRKALVKAISDATGEKAVYKFTPTYSYEIGAFTVTRYGVLEFDDGTDADGVLAALKEAGFEGETEETDARCDVPDESEDGEEAADGSSPKIDGLAIEMPRGFYTDAALENLKKLVDGKSTLIKEAIGTDSLPIEVTEERVAFPWFRTLEADEAKAYAEFVSKLSIMAREAKRVTATDKATDNPKYAFRCFLLRLGFIGPEYKASRKILLRNLSGNSSWKNGRKEVAEDDVSE